MSKGVKNKETRIACEWCKRPKCGERRVIEGFVLELCAQCDADFFQRGPALARARGEKWDPATAGKGKM